MKKFLFIISGIIFLTAAIPLFAASFTIDNLNLRERFPAQDFPAAYFKIGLEETWNKINDAQNLPLSRVTIGILDTGVDTTHKEFNGINWGTTPPTAKQDMGVLENGILTSHGTNVAGIIGANNISATSSANYVPPQMNGVLSGAKNLSYILENRVIARPLAISFGFPLFTIAKQINEISDRGGKIINISQATETVAGRISDWIATMLGGSFGVIPHHPDTLFIVAVGNGGVSVIGGGQFGLDISPANLGNLPNVITVGATNINDTRWTAPEIFKGSNYGNEVSLSAPGDAVFSPTFYGKPYHYPPMISDYDDFSGTSASTPLVTGVAGLLKSIKPSLTPAQIKQILIRTADPIFAEEGSDEAEMPLGSGCTATSIPPGMTKRGCRLNAYRAVCDSDVLNCETDPVAFFEGWESVPLGHPLCETLPPYMTGYGVCGFTADSGKWVVTDLASIGSPMLSLEILPGKILKLKPQLNYMNGYLFRQIRTAGNFFIPLSPTTSLSFTDYAISTTSVPSRVDLIVNFDKAGNPALCPETGNTTSFTTIWYVLEDNSGNPSEEIPPCTARVVLPSSTSFSRNLHDDFADLLPFSPEGWELSHITFQVFSYGAWDQEVSATWDNVKIMR